MGDIDNPNNMIIIPPLPGRKLKRSVPDHHQIFAAILQYIYDYNVTIPIVKYLDNRL